MAMRKCESVRYIPLSDVKKGEFITLHNDKTYVVVKQGQNYKLIPIDLNNVITINEFSVIDKPIIKAVFDAKNGNMLKVLSKDEE